MLHGYTLIAVSHEQALNILAEATAPIALLDIGSGTATIMRHPMHGDMIVIDNAIGKCAIALRRGHVEKFTNSLHPKLGD